MKIYLGCSLYNASPEYLTQIDSIKDSIRSQYELIEFLGIGAEHTCEQVVEYDLSCVRKCDVMLGICDAPSTGMGIEIGLANSLQKPILLVAKNEDVSRMIRGNHAENPKCRFVTYNSPNDLLEKLAQFISKNKKDS